MLTIAEMEIAARMHGQDYGKFSFALKCGAAELPPIEKIRSQIVKKERKSGSTKNDTPVCQYDMKGELVRVYDNARQAAEAFGGKSAGNIIAACEGRYMTTRGFQWRFIDADPPGIFKPPAKVHEPKPAIEKICAFCGKKFMGKGPAKFCSDDCRKLAKAKSNREKAKRARKKKKAQNRK